MPVSKAASKNAGPRPRQRWLVLLKVSIDGQHFPSSSFAIADSAFFNGVDGQPLDENWRNAKEVIDAFVLHAPVDVLWHRNDEVIHSTIFEVQENVNVIVIRIDSVYTAHDLDVHDIIMPDGRYVAIS